MQSAKLCRCGSGITAHHCCDWNPPPPGGAPDPRAAAIAEQAASTHAAGNFAAAAPLAVAALEHAPGHVGALTVLSDICRSQGHAAANEALLRRIVLLDPNNSWAINRLALLLLEKGDLSEAELHARNAVRTAPESAQSHYLLGLVLTEGNRPAYGEHHLLRALDIAGPNDPVLFANLGLCLKLQGKMREARAAYARSLDLAPRAVSTLLGLARLEEADRDLAAAATWLDRADRIEPDHPGSLLLRAAILGRQRETEKALTLLDHLAARRTDLNPGEWLEKGRLLDAAGRYAEAFDAFEQGKSRLRATSGQAYDADHAQHAAARLRGFFTRRRLRTLPRAGVRSDVAQPLFVLGFPRSGTTLLEQTLTAHSRIAAGDELPFIADITSIMPRMLASPLTYPEALSELWMGDHRDDLDNLRDYYLQRAVQLGIAMPGKPWFTDKMPLNEMNLGLIALLFPQSPLLHVVRHPLDVVLSVFSNLLTHGYRCAYALESIAQHYVLIANLVDYYRQQMDLRYLRVAYEDMVADQEATVRRVLSFIGEPFEPGCLEFHENRRYARTASYAQVTEKLYATSCGRYTHYLPQLRPIIPILRPVFERLGYAIEE